MLSPRAIAMQGVGSAVLVFALQGLVGEESGAAQIEVGGGISRRRRQDAEKKRFFADDMLDIAIALVMSGALDH